ESVQVTPPAPVLDVYDTAQPELTLSAPERLMGQVKVGSNLKVAVPSAGFTGKGQVVRIVPVINERSRTFQVVAKFEH
ncbi:HlyD family efflux transporter periplasmic adaptor subunit, partial [Enterococcus casseliflavus]|uniref:HlyD family efflux transporter periplasmic adaptor subunit n=1 Tax=Enterococcus casseliflavus TaxID=37734 RepID=UPI003D11F3DD